MISKAKLAVFLFFFASCPVMLAVEISKVPNSAKTPQAYDASNPSGEGLLLVDVDYETGRVTSVHVLRSTGRKRLDDYFSNVVRRWHFQPKTYTKIKVPFSLATMFSIRDVEKYLAPRRHNKPVVIYAPPPRYPMQMLHMGASGHGKYQLTLGADGTVSDVRTVETTGDRRFGL